jgi:hypothetical protein
VVVGERTLRANPVWEGYLVVGRHARCGIVLARDRSVALRHLLVRSIALPNGGVSLRVLDLATRNGFGVADGSSARSILSEGPIAVSLGSHALVALPAGTGTKSDTLPRELPTLSVEESAGGPRALGPYRVNAKPASSRRLAVLPRAVLASDLVDRDRRRLEYGAHTITVERSGPSVRTSVTEEDLVGGVLFGSSEEDESRPSDDTVSRVHVLVLREGRHVYAYDLASSYGTFMNGAPVGRIALGRRSSLTLGRGSQAIRLIWEKAQA